MGGGGAGIAAGGGVVGFISSGAVGAGAVPAAHATVNNPRQPATKEPEIRDEAICASPLFEPETRT
jgi:hypothetical protein